MVKRICTYPHFPDLERDLHDKGRYWEQDQPKLLICLKVEVFSPATCMKATFCFNASVPHPSLHAAVAVQFSDIATEQNSLNV